MFFCLVWLVNCDIDVNFNVTSLYLNPIIIFQIQHKYQSCWARQLQMHMREHVSSPQSTYMKWCASHRISQNSSTTRTWSVMLWSQFEVGDEEHFLLFNKCYSGSCCISFRWNGTMLFVVRSMRSGGCKLGQILLDYLAKYCRQCL